MWENDLAKYLPLLITATVLMVGWRLRSIWVVWMVPVLSVGFVAWWWWGTYNDLQTVLAPVYDARPEDVVR